MSRTVKIFKPFPLFHQLVWLYLKEHEGILIFSAMNPLLLPIILGALLQSWWALGGSFLGGLALFALYLWLRNQLSNSSNIVSVSLAAFLIAIGWSVVGWFFGLSLQGVPLVFAIACFIVGFFGNAFIFYIIDEWSIWKLYINRIALAGFLYWLRAPCVWITYIMALPSF